MTTSYGPETKIDELAFCFLDIETTGLSPATGGKICEVAIIKSGTAGRLDTYSQLINPRCLIPEAVIRIHGITNDMVNDKPAFSQAAPAMLDFLENSVVVCHNADFDVPFMAYEFAAIGLRFPPLTILDTLKFARKHAKFKSNRLGNIAIELGFSNDGWHRALNDAAMTEKLFMHFVGKFRACGAETLGALTDLQTGKKAGINKERTNERISF